MMPLDQSLLHRIDQLEQEVLSSLRDLRIQIESTLPSSPENRDGRLFASQLQNGSLVVNRPIAMNDRSRLLDDVEETLVVDEVSFMLYVPDKVRPIWLGHISFPIRLFLLHTIRSVGRKFTLDEFIDSHPEWNGTAGRDQWISCIHQYRRRIKEVLGPDLCKNIYGRAKGGGYAVNDTGWQLIWIRRSMDWRESILASGDIS